MAVSVLPQLVAHSSSILQCANEVSLAAFHGRTSGYGIRTSGSVFCRALHNIEANFEFVFNVRSYSFAM